MQARGQPISNSHCCLPPPHSNTTQAPHHKEYEPHTTYNLLHGPHILSLLQAVISLLSFGTAELISRASSRDPTGSGGSNQGPWAPPWQERPWGTGRHCIQAGAFA